VAEGKSVAIEFYVQTGRTVEAHFESEAAIYRERKLVPFCTTTPLFFVLRQQSASCRIVTWRRSASHHIHLTSHQPTFHSPQIRNSPQKNKKISGS
jgi:hypothetical protein